MGQRTAPPLLLLLLSFNNCFSMRNFVLATKRYISFDIHVLYFIVFFLMSMFVLAAKLLFIDSYYFLLVQLLNDLYQQSLFVCSCSKRAQGSAIKHQQGIK